jgi:hypothetical protein
MVRAAVELVRPAVGLPPVGLGLLAVVWLRGDDLGLL